LERLEFTDPRHPEVVADRGRRPHVPSSKPTMSKSRRVFSPLCIGATGLPIKKTQTGSGKPCPAGEGAIYGRLIRPSMAFFSDFSRLRQPANRCRARGRRRNGPGRKAAPDGAKIGSRSRPSRPRRLVFQREPTV
jgi:hypothetical protein